MSASPVTRLAGRVRTAAATALPADLTSAAPAPTGVLALVRGGDGLVGWGQYARFTASGPDAARRIEDWFAEACAGLTVSDEVTVPGSGPIAFVSLGFDDADTSVAVVPRIVVGRRAGRSFITRIDGEPASTMTPPDRAPVPIHRPGQVSWSDAGLTVAGFTAAVAEATGRIRAGELAKVVLAHDLVATTEFDVDHRFLLARLGTAYPSCWTFAVDGLIGSSPEMLLRRRGAHITSRVLAGTAWPHHAGESVSVELLASNKDRAEHEFAVRSVADALTPVTEQLTVPAQPQPLILANLTHLATDISGRLGPARPTALELVGLLHPTAAVGGTPTSAARALIRELEPTPRGRYAAPVGWIDATGDGEFAIALRCAEVAGRTVRLMAGCGIVADSDPDSEAREAQIKMIPVRDALESR